MDILLTLIIGAALGFGIASWRSGRRTQPSGPSELLPPKPTPSEATEASMPERLKALLPELASAAEDSAHPRDLLQNAAFNEVVALFKSDTVSVATVTDYATGANWHLATAALSALCDRSDRDQAGTAIIAHGRHYYPWPLFFALRLYTSLRERPEVGAIVLRTPPWWLESPLVPSFLNEYFTAREQSNDEPRFGPSLAELKAEEFDAADALLRRIQHPFATALLGELNAWRRGALDRSFLQSFGRFWESDLDQKLTVEHDAIADQLAIASACIAHSPPRSILIVGEPRSGKTSFLKACAARAVDEGWTIFEAGAASLMAGQQYFGQLEERLRRITTELSAAKKVIWYVPDFLQLATSGTHQGQAASILDQVFAAVASGQVIVWSEATPAGVTRLLQAKPALRGALEIIRLRALTDEQVDRLAERFASRMREVLGIAANESALEGAAHLTKHYFGSSQMPGALIDVLKLAAQHAAANNGTAVTLEDLLHTMAQVTGMPRSVLDDRERVDLTAVRKYFDQRVIGQIEAVSAVVDRIAMLKAGLTDPTRPIGVFLFAGPTGTGKTELAKTLAEYLFGSADRMLRLDMSEFQHPESTRKLLGEPRDPHDSESLTQRIRKQPFAVVLLDEFEKAHPNIWDLFLQVFDDGRLTDAAGHTADFRHAIIILTSNLGATAHQDAGMGFSPQSSAFSREQIMRAVSHNFRPEFVNRLDKVIVFRPLTRDLMRGILHKELARVLERRGLKNREWAVEWESSALEFLLDRGFTPSMGARPLKRAIDQHLLAPLAATMVEHRFPTGEQFLFVRSDGQSIQVEFVDPDDEPNTPAESATHVAPTTTAKLILQSNGTTSERDILTHTLATLEETLTSGSLETLRQDLQREMNANDFWDRDDRHDILARYALIDRVRAALDTARSLSHRLERSRTAHDSFSRDLMARLALQLHLVDAGIEDLRVSAPVEVALIVQPAMESSSDPGDLIDWRAQLTQMYRNWAQSRRMQLNEWQLQAGAVLVVSGFGAARTLLAEQGLHVLETEDGNESGRTVVRVKVAVVPANTPDDHRRKAVLTALLQQAPSSATVIRRYRFGSAPLIRDSRLQWRTGRAQLVMDGHFDVINAIAAS